MSPAHATKGNIAFLMLLLPSLLLTYISEAVAEQLPVKAYTVADGLAHNRVKRIVQDSHGFLWFCTADGLSRFDGYRFTNYRVDDGLPAPSINDLLETGDGVYWVATNSDGVVRFNLHAGSPTLTGEPAKSRFTVYPISNEPVTNRVNVLYRDRGGMVWVGTDGGLFYLNDAKGEGAFHRVELGIPSRPDLEVQVWAMAEDRAGSLWIGTKFGLLRRLPNGRMTHYEIQPSPSDDTVLALLADDKGKLWVGHRTGLVTFDPAQTFPLTDGRAVSTALPAGARRYTTADGLHNNEVMAIYQSSDGRVWIRTFGGGLTEFDGEAFRAYVVAQRFGDNLGSLTEDRDGNLWLGTKAGGVLKVTRHGFITYGQDDGLGQSISSIFENRTGELYVNSSVWLVSHFDGGRFTTVRPGLAKSVTDTSWRGVSSVLEDHTGQWWVATREGLYRFPKVDRFEQLARARPKAVYTTSDGLANNDVSRLFEDSHGDIWIASFVPGREVLTRWERATSSFRQYSEADGLRPFTSVLAISEDAAGNIWVGFREGGLARYRAGRFTALGPDEGLPAGTINSIYLDRANRLWVTASRGGLCRIDDPEAERPRVVRYTKAEGLATDHVLYVTGDSAGRIYVGSSRGIDRLDPETRQVKHYSTADGLTGGEFTAAFCDQRGALWFGSTTGLSRLIPEPDRPTLPPPILIGGLSVAGRPQPLSALGETVISGLEFDSGQNNIQIDFFGMDFGAGEALRYQYKLEGANEDWSELSDQRTVNYASLAPGTYRFLVRAVGTDGTLSESPATVSFRIFPPVWQRWWFVAIAALVVGSAVFVFARSRYTRLKSLRESENRFRTLAETASDAIITIDEESRIVLVNKAAERVFGYTRKEMTGAELTMVMPEYLRHLHQAGFTRYKQTGKRHIPWEAVELPGLHKDGREIPLELSFGEFVRNDKRFFTGIARDITERKRAEEALRRSREERLAELERVRKRIATDLHDDIGSSLTRISLLSEVARRQVGAGEVSLLESLSSVGRLSRELVDSMSDIVWAINPNKDHLSDLSQRMRHFASDVFTARQIEFRFRAPDAERDVKVGANVRREFFLVFKEAVNNTVRHSGCAVAEIEFRAEDEGLFLKLSDDGRGFDVSHASTGHGLMSMRERTEGLGGQVEVISGPGQGTTLTFSIPLGDQRQSTSSMAAGRS
jgi:PAS domain S-box-containing protein